MDNKDIETYGEYLKNALAFYNKVQEETMKNGKYIVKDPNEIVYPFDGMIVCVGKRKCVKLKVGNI